MEVYPDTKITKQWLKHITKIRKNNPTKADDTCHFLYFDMLEYIRKKYPRNVKHCKGNVYFIFGSHWGVIERTEGHPYAD